MDHTRQCKLVARTFFSHLAGKKFEDKRFARVALALAAKWESDVF